MYDFRLSILTSWSPKLPKHIVQNILNQNGELVLWWFSSSFRISLENQPLYTTFIIARSVLGLPTDSTNHHRCQSASPPNPTGNMWLRRCRYGIYVFLQVHGEGLQRGPTAPTNSDDFWWDSCKEGPCLIHVHLLLYTDRKSGISHLPLAQLPGELAWSEYIYICIIIQLYHII